MTLSVIIISYNTKELTLQAVKSVVSSIQDKKLLDQIEILVVDNNSQDDSVSALTKLKPTLGVPLTVFKNSENLGFAAANNQAISISKGEFVLLLNSDTEVQPGALEELLAVFSKFPVSEISPYEARIDLPTDRLGIIACGLKNPDGSPQPQGGMLPNLLTLSSQMFFLDDLPIIGHFLPSTQQRDTSLLESRKDLISFGWVAGTAMCIRRATIDEIGDLDENIFMYGEDMEYCLRANKHHWDVGIAPRSVVIHHKTASSSEENALVGELKGYRYIWAKHLPLWQRPFLEFVLRFAVILRIVVFTIIGKGRTAHTYLKILKKL